MSQAASRNGRRCQESSSTVARLRAADLNPPDRGWGGPLDGFGGWIYPLLSVTDWRPVLSKPTDLVQGTLALLILRILALEPMHGWAVAQRIRQMSNEQLRVGQSALYPALHKLEQQGWIASEWASSENNRRAKYYRLTAAGRKALKAETAQWTRLAAAISLIVKPV